MLNDPHLSLRHALLLAVGACGEAVSPAQTVVRVEDDRRLVEPSPAASPASPTGYIKEPDGTVHRAGPETCDPGTTLPACTDPTPGNEKCAADEQCTTGAHGRCVQGYGQLGRYCRCDYACSADADCNPDQVCVCSDALGGSERSRCVAAACRADADCDSGRCDLSVYNWGCDTERRLACRTLGDTCKSDADCDPKTFCVFHEDEGRWTCRGSTCVVGRPFLVDGVACTAPTVGRPDWLTTLELPGELPPELAVAVATHWAEIAALEHASVASFARFTLDLMALGAPPDLLAGAQRAALDEVRHARIAWTLAARWSDRELGPGSLSFAGLSPTHDLAGVVVALVKEGCVGETLGAAEARALAERSGHPTLAPLLAAISEDEAGHAALAWRTLRWLVDTHGEPVRRLARAALAEARAELLGAPHPCDEGPAAPTWGLLPRHELLAIRSETLGAVIEPVFDACIGPGVT